LGDVSADCHLGEVPCRIFWSLPDYKRLRVLRGNSEALSRYFIGENYSKNDGNSIFMNRDFGKKTNKPLDETAAWAKSRIFGRIPAVKKVRAERNYILSLIPRTTASPSAEGVISATITFTQGGACAFICNNGASS
jgi:hypothetical protein